MSAVVLTQPGLSKTTHEDLSTLIQSKLDARERLKLDLTKKIESAEVTFRRHAVHLMKSIVDASTAHRPRIMLTATISRDPSGYGVTVTKRFKTKETQKTARIVMTDPEAPNLVRFDHEKSNGFFYDLASTIPHGSPLGFSRPYIALLEDLASWIVSGLT